MSEYPFDPDFLPDNLRHIETPDEPVDVATSKIPSYYRTCPHVTGAMIATGSNAGDDKARK